MSLQDVEPFDISGFPVDSFDSATSVLVTGDDSETLAKVTAQVVTPDPQADEQVLLLGTTDVDAVVRGVTQTSRDNADLIHVITEPDQQVPQVSQTSQVNNIGDMTALSMQFSDAIGEMESDRSRLGIFLCSDMCRSVDDIRSVYRFLNTSFLSELRRNQAIGICAVETDTTLQTDVDSMIASMSSSFDLHLRLEESSRRSATFSAEGLPSLPDTVTVST